uniref:Barstar n=1 Tax=Arsenophonus endosymbiont of Trialeurodes vaporariorum TaxID=235567 RepID=A0A3B0LY37_9GAMM
MMHCVEFDFREIVSLNDCYQKAILVFELPKWFGQNLDALGDMLTGGIVLPVEVIFSHINEYQLTEFAELITVFREAEQTLGGKFIFHCRASQSNPA